MSHRVERIANEFFTLEVLPEIGASVLNLRSAAGRPVLRAVDVEDVRTSSQCASFTLLPFSNRIRDARFTFEGREYPLQVNTKDGLAQHGDVRNRPWRVTRLSDAHLRCEFDSREHIGVNWPWAFTAQVEYLLHGPHFDTSVTLTNADTTAMPAGMGLHPYFARVADGVDPLLHFDAPLVYDIDGCLLALGEARAVRPDEDFTAPNPVGDRHIDATFTAWNGIARLSWGEVLSGGRAVVLTADNVYSHLVVFTAPDGSLALEPVSHATDAFNLAARGVGGVDLRVLAPGQSLAGTARVTLEGNWSSP